jgi:hypothetical protein
MNFKLSHYPDVLTHKRPTNEQRKPYLSIKELAQLIPWSEKTIRHKMKKHFFIEGKHYHKPDDRRPFFDWEAVQRLIKGDE